MGTVATDILQKVDENSGLTINYRKTNTAFDGTPITDLKCDGVIYRKTYNNEYVKLVSEIEGEYPYEFFGAVADGVTDCYPAFVKAQESFRKLGGEGFVITFGKGNYYHSETLQLKAPLVLKGLTKGKNGYNGTTRFTFPPNKGGVVVNRYNTLGTLNVSADIGGADNASITGIEFFSQSNAKYGFVLDVNGNKAFVLSARPIQSSSTAVKKISGDGVTPIYTQDITSVDLQVQVIELNTSHSYVVGDTITGQTSGATGVICMLGSSANTLCLKSVTGTFTAGENITNGTSVKMLYKHYFFNWDSVWMGQVINFSNNVSGVVTQRDTLIPAENFGNGITLIARAIIKDCKISNFNAHGIATISDGPSNANSNCFLIDDILINYCGSHGIYHKGGDTNAGVTKNCSIDICGGAAIYDDSFLGNYHSGHHSSYCVGGGYIQPLTQPNSATSFTDCYDEGGFVTDPYILANSQVAKSGILRGGTRGLPFNGSFLNGNQMNLGGFNTYKDSHTQIFGAPNERGIYTSAGGGSTSNTGGIAFTYPTSIVQKIEDLRDLTSFSFDSEMNPYYNVFKLGVRNYFGGNSFIETFNTSGQNAKFHPIVKNNIAQKIMILEAGFGYKTGDRIRGVNALNGLTGYVIAQGGKVISVVIETPNTSYAADNDSLTYKLGFDYTAIFPLDLTYNLGKSEMPFNSIYSQKLFLNGIELKRANTSMDSANTISSTYSQTEVQSILDELRDLKSKMRDAGLLA